MESKICGVVILYNPTIDIYNNMVSYYDQVDIIIAVDNSDIVNKELVERIKSLDNIVYIFNNGNLGIAKALNLAADYAIAKGFRFILTMDQDTPLPRDSVKKLMSRFDDFSQVGIISPHHNNIIIPQPVEDSNVHESLEVMMCGNIVNLEAYNKVGKFEEKLYIDYVDHDFCLRLNLGGYKVIQDNSISLMHKLGNRKIKKFLFMQFCPSNHEAIRLYYRTRNRFFVYKKFWKNFPLHVLRDIMFMIRQFLSVILLEEDKIRKVRMMWLGVYDFLNNNYGKFQRQH